MPDGSSGSPARWDLLFGTLIWFAVSNSILVGLILLLFNLDGFWRIPGIFLIVITVLLDWRTIRHIVKLARGDLSL